MEASLSRQGGPHFLSNWTWSNWLGVSFLILLGCLIPIWPLPLLILSAILLFLLGSLVRPSVAIVIAILLLGFECIGLGYLAIDQSYVFGLNYYIGLVGFLCWCVARLAGVTPPYQSTTLDLPLAIFVVSCIISLLWSNYPQDGLTIIISLVMSYCMYLLISALICTPRDLQRFFWLWFALGNIIVIGHIATSFCSDYLNHFNIYGNFSLVISLTQFKGTRETLKGFVGTAKATAALLNVAILCGLPLICTRVRPLSKVLIYLSLLGMLFIQFLSVSRLEMIGLFLGWLAFAHLNPQWRNARTRHHLLMMVSVVVVFLAVLTVLSTFYFGSTELFARLFAQEQTAGTGYRFSGAQSRRDYVIHALTGLWETGGLGGGVGGIMRGMSPDSWIDPPSLYFSFLVNHGYGILSFILMGWIMLNVIMELRWALLNCPDPRHKLFIIGVCSILLMFGSPLADNFCFGFYTWVMLGFAVAAAKGVRYLVQYSTLPPPSGRI